jgi:hypothetical protein
MTEPTHYAMSYNRLIWHHTAETYLECNLLLWTAFCTSGNITEEAVQKEGSVETWSDIIEERRSELERKIYELQPSVDQWALLKKELELLKQVHELQPGEGQPFANKWPTMPTQTSSRKWGDYLGDNDLITEIYGGTPMPKGGWKKICNENGWYVGGDSAHRVVRRKDPGLHAGLEHECDYDRRTYP